MNHYTAQRAPTQFREAGGIRSPKKITQPTLVVNDSNHGAQYRIPRAVGCARHAVLKGGASVEEETRT
jgi:hypothetical protein